GLVHVGRVELGAGRTRADAVNERLVAVQQVPGAVVDVDVAGGGRVVGACQQSLAVAPDLLPEQRVDDLAGIDQQTHGLTVAFGQVGQVSAQGHFGITGDAGGHVGSFAGAGSGGGGRRGGVGLA